MYLQNISQDFLLEVKPQKRVPNFLQLHTV